MPFNTASISFSAPEKNRAPHTILDGKHELARLSQHYNVSGLIPRLHSPAFLVLCFSRVVFFYTVREKLGSESWEVEPRNEAITMYLAAIIYLRVYQRYSGLYYVQNTILS